METFWIYLFSYLLAIAIGVVIGMLIDKDNTYKVTIRKIKQRGRGNTLESELDVNLTPKTKSGGVLSKWRQKRNEKKAKKAKKRLNKNT